MGRRVSFESSGLSQSASENASPLIACKDLSLTFTHGRHSQRVLDRLSLSVNEGQIVTLLGPSGCGKSTLLRVIAGLINCNDGQATIRSAIASVSMPMSVRREIAFVFQESALLPWRSVWNNVLLPLELRGTASTSQSRSRCIELLELVGFTKTDWKKLPSQLSGGMKMRASIARAMSTSPKILLLDEPFAALDDMLRSKLNDLLLAISAKERCTMLFVTHNIAEAIYLSDEIAIMSRGKIAERMKVPFAFPREASLRSTAAFASYYGRVVDALTASTLRATASSGNISTGSST
jgi:NitT/TauT family transport system ATP-binding protein